jgi:hypothetical protein
MTVALTLIAAVVLAAATTVLVMTAMPGCSRPRLTGATVVVNTVGATSLRGVVHGEHADRLVLRDATVLVVGADAEVPAGGSLHVFRDRIDFVQRLEPPRARSPRELGRP